MADKIAKLIKNPVVVIFLSIIVGFIVGAFVLAAAGFNPVLAYSALLRGVFSKPKYIAQTIINATPIIITGISVAFAFKTGLFNIGAEGQFIMGSVVAAFVGYRLALPSPLHPLVVILLAMIAGGIWGGIVGFLKAKFGIHEVITSIMLNWTAFYFNNYYITLPGIKKPNTEASFEVLESAFIKVLYKYKTSEAGLNKLSQNEFLREVLLKTDLNYGILIAILVAIIIWYILSRTTLGFGLRAVGLNKDAAEFSGIPVKKNIILAMVIAGAISGLAGAVYVTGNLPHRITTLAALEGFGLNGITVALIANLNPLGCILSGLLFGGLKYGGGTIQSEMGAPSEIINIMLGTIVFFISMGNLFVLISEKIKKRGGGNAH